MKEFKNVCMFFGADEDLSMDAFEDASDSPFDDAGSANTTDSPFDEDNKEKPAEVVDPKVVFDEDNPLGIVGDDSDNEEEKVEPPKSDKDKGSSPKLTHSSAYLKALKDDGVLPDLTDEFIQEATTPEKFAEAIELQVKARMDERQKRIDDALSVNVQIDDIKRYENAITYLDGIEEDVLIDESDESENLRKQIIYQDYINKGFKPERAQKEVTKSFNAGTDIEDAKLALESNKEYFKEEYDELIEKNKLNDKQEKHLRDQQVSEFKKKVLETEEPFGIKVDKNTRQKVLDNIVKPVHKDKDGKLLTSLQKYSKENPSDSEYYFSLFYELTDGFKNVDKLVGQKVKQNTKSALRSLDNKLKNAPLNGDGSFDFNSGLDDQSHLSTLPKGWKFA
jgi:hypothetical protein